MPGIRNQAEQIIHKLREAEVPLFRESPLPRFARSLLEPNGPMTIGCVNVVV